jgi:hypothetical protein
MFGALTRFGAAVHLVGVESSAQFNVFKEHHILAGRLSDFEHNADH